MVTNTKAETLRHYIVKCLIYKRLKELGRKANCEYDTEGLGILDDVDWTEGYVFEVIEGTLSKKAINSKLERYLKISGIIDVIFIYTDVFSLTDSIEVWYNTIKDLIL